MFSPDRPWSQPGLHAGPCEGGAGGGGDVCEGGYWHKECPHGLQSQVFSGQSMEQVQGKVCQELLLRS